MTVRKLDTSGYIYRQISMKSSEQPDFTLIPILSISESAHNFRFRGVRGRGDGDLAGFLPGELGHAHLGVGQSQGPGLAAALLVLLGHLGRLASRHRARYVATKRL